MSGRAAWRTQGPMGFDPGEIAWSTAVLFMIGSACFALGATPGFSSAVPTSVVGTVFFIGSLFFTTAGYLQFVQSINFDREPGAPWRRFAVQADRLDWWAAAVQSVGTLWFNVNTFEAMQTGFTTHEQNLRIWTPDFIGSICFLVASGFAMAEVGHRPWRVERSDPSWWISAINMAGSVFFMASAFAAFVLPSTGDLLDASLANSGTFLGAVCFYWAARISIVPMDRSARR